MDGFASINAGLLKELLVICGAICAFIGGALVVWSQLRRPEKLPQPVLVEEAPKVVSHDAHARTVERVAALEIRMSRVETKMESDKNEIIRAVDEKIERLEDRVQNIPAQVVALLKDTKGLLS